MFELGYLYVGLAVVLLGLSKGGFGGVGATAAVPLMALGVDAELALGALLVLLLCADVVSVTAHLKNADTKIIWVTLPSAAVGILLGASVIAFAPATLIGIVIGILAIAFGIMSLTGWKINMANSPNWIGSVFGATSGATSTLAHAGGPPIHMYFLSRGYEPKEFVATSACFMAGVNIIKIVPFLVVGALDREAAILALYLAPLALVSSYAGVLVSRVISNAVFKYTVSALMIAAGAKLIFDAVVG